MLSPGKWHEKVPRTLHANLVYRRKLLALADRDHAVRKELRRRCKDDILFFINSFGWQFDPSQRGVRAVAPFITFPIQEHVLIARPETHAQFEPYDRGILWCYENDKTLALEKSRWQGASWLFQICEGWLCSFHEYVQILNISRNEDAVDDGTKDSLFWKLNYFLRRCPEWLIGPFEKSRLYFNFPLTESEIVGTATTDAAGVGGRASIIFIDEYPEIKAGQEVREKTALTANCRFFNGTHLGVGTPFHDMCNPKKSPEIVRQRMHWTQNPQQTPGLYEFDPANPTIPILLDPGYKYPSGFRFVLDGTPVGGPRPGVRSPWYDKKCVEIGDERAIASNLDISPEGAAKQFFNALKIRNIEATTAKPPLWVGELEYDPAGRPRGLREDPDGKLKLWVRPILDGHSIVKSRYVVGADIAAGNGATPSCFAIIDGNLSCKVGEYANPWIEERPFAQYCVAMCRWLVDSRDGTAYFIWDSSGQQGVKFETEVLRLQYTNFYHNEDDLRHLHRDRSQRRPGWYSSNEQKYDLFKDLKTALYEGTYIERSSECFHEMHLFEYDAKTNVVQHSGERLTNDPTGARKNHGDRCTATGLAWMGAKEMAAGGRRELRYEEQIQPGSIGWLLELQKLRNRNEEEPAYQ